MQLTTKEIDHFVGFIQIEPNTITFERPPGIYELISINNAFKKSVEVKADEKTMKTILTAEHEIIFNSELNDVVGFTKKKCSAGTYPGGNHTNIINIGTFCLKYDCMDGSIVNGRHDGIFFFFYLCAPLGFEIFEEPKSILVKKVNNDRVGVISFYLEEGDGSIVDFAGETLTTTVK